MPKKIHAVILMVIVFFSACATASTNRDLDRAIENMAQEISHLFPSETQVTVDIKDVPDNQLRDYIITELNTHLRGSGIIASAAQSNSTRAQGQNQIAGYLISADDAYPFLIAAQDVPEPPVVAVAKTPVAAVAETPLRKKAFDTAQPDEKFEPEVVKRDYYINALAVFNRPASLPAPIAAPEPPKPPARVIPAIAQYINALANFRAAVAPPPVSAPLPAPVAASGPPNPPASVIPVIAQYINALATFRAAIEQIGRVDTTPNIWVVNYAAPKGGMYEDVLIWLANDPEPIAWCERIVPIIRLKKADEIRIWHENLVAAIGRADTVAVIGREYLDPAKSWLTDTAIIGEHDLEKARSWLAELEKRLRRSAAAIVAEADSGQSIGSRSIAPPEGGNVVLAGSLQGYALQAIPFYLDSAELNDAALTLLAQHGATLKQQYPDRSIVIQGHCALTDEEEGDAVPKSRERAQNVANYLVRENYIRADQYEIQALGVTMPFATNDTWTGRQQNRRATIIIVQN
ncbi:OmpA family protein [Breznakiellaceae bacterium SP9]